MSRTTPQLSKADLAALVETGRELALEITLPPLLQLILDRATRLTDSPDSSLILRHDKREGLYFAHATGENAATLLARWGRNSEQSVPLTGSKAGEVFSTGRPAVINVVPDDPNHFKKIDRDTGTPTASMVCVPLTAAGERIGVVQLLNKRSGPYSPRDLLLLEHFAAHAAVAIRNARTLEDLLGHMGLYANQARPDQLTELLAELKRPPRSEMLSVLFADMRGSTQLWNVEKRPERAQQLIDEFLGMLADAVLGREGMVNKYLGDGLMALFRGPGHAVRAVESAAAMRDGFGRLRAQWDQRSNVSLRFLDLGIGIATDTVIFGSVGAGRVREYTALGTAVNLASHLTEQARGGRNLLVDKMTYWAVQDVVADYEGPEEFELKKPGQAVGHPYDRYHIKRLKTGAAGEPGGTNPRQPGGVAELDGRQMEALLAAFCAAFDLKTLDRMLKFRLEKDRAPLVASGSLQEVSFELILLANREGWHLDLIAAACEYVPNNPALRKFCLEYPALCPR